MPSYIDKRRLFMGLGCSNRLRISLRLFTSRRDTIWYQSSQHYVHLLSQWQPWLPLPQGGRSSLLLSGQLLGSPEDFETKIRRKETNRQAIRVANQRMDRYFQNPRQARLLRNRYPNRSRHLRRREPNAGADKPFMLTTLTSLTWKNRSSARHSPRKCR